MFLIYFSYVNMLVLMGLLRKGVSSGSINIVILDFVLGLGSCFFFGLFFILLWELKDFNEDSVGKIAWDASGFITSFVIFILSFK